MLPILLCASEACPLLYRQKHSFEFTITRIFMRLFHTGSPVTVKDCQINFGFLPVASQLAIRTAKFLQKFIALENSLCTLFSCTASTQLNVLFAQYNSSLHTACQLNNYIQEQFYS